MLRVQCQECGRKIVREFEDWQVPTRVECICNHTIRINWDAQMPPREWPKDDEGSDKRPSRVQQIF